MKTSAPGKLMLFGEHAVVYGYPCIVTAISERLDVTLSDVDDLPTDRRFVDAAIRAWGNGKDIKVKARSAFSGVYGFGSSSAVTVATLKALRPDADNRTVFETAYKIVLDIQGVGSGFDVASATFGGTMYFVQGGKVMEPLAVGEIPLVVGYTGVKSNTVDMVGSVSEKRTKYPEKVERIFQGITKLVEEAKGKMIEGDWERVGRLMDFNHEYLRDLGVSSEKLESLISAAKRAGAWGAKLSGAGGGDCMIALAPPDKRMAIEESITTAGGEVVRVTPNAQGVRIDLPAGEAGTTDDQQELFIVVDENDNILGYKSRWECHHDSSLIHRTIGVLLFNDKGQLLVQKRSMSKDMEAGKWCVSAAGHVRKGQSDEEAAHRELEEELGVDAPLTFFRKFITKNANESERAVLFKCKSNGPFTPHPQEISEVKFLDPREIRLLTASHKLIFTDAAMRSLTEAGIL